MADTPLKQLWQSWLSLRSVKADQHNWLSDLRGSVECLAASVVRERISPRLEVGNDDRHTGPALCSDKQAPALLRRPNSLVALPLAILACLTLARLTQLCTKVAVNVQLSSAQNPEISGISTIRVWSAHFRIESRPCSHQLCIQPHLGETESVQPQTAAALHHSAHRSQLELGAGRLPVLARS